MENTNPSAEVVNDTEEKKTVSPCATCMWRSVGYDSCDTCSWWRASHRVNG